MLIPDQDQPLDSSDSEVESSATVSHSCYLAVCSTMPSQGDKRYKDEFGDMPDLVDSPREPRPEPYVYTPLEPWLPKKFMNPLVLNQLLLHHIPPSLIAR